MIKASTRTALGQPMLLPGLSGENVTRLAAANAAARALRDGHG